jgi:hypothetical protein
MVGIKPFLKLGGSYILFGHGGRLKEIVTFCNFFIAIGVTIRNLDSRKSHKPAMTATASKPTQAPAAPAPAPDEDGLITLNLGEVLTADELAAFRAKANAAGRSISDHFKAITFGTESAA